MSNKNKHSFVDGVVKNDKGEGLTSLNQIYDNECTCKFDCCLNAIVLDDNKTGETTYIVVENNALVLYTDVAELKAAKTV